MKLTLDIEHTVTERDGKIHFDPFEPDNSLVMIGTLTDQGEEKLFTIYRIFRFKYISLFLFKYQMAAWTLITN